jgi:UDP-glucose 6-dehydrogenase
MYGLQSLAKLASNAMLAQRISSINSLSAFVKKQELILMSFLKPLEWITGLGRNFLEPQ